MVLQATAVGPYSSLSIEAHARLTRALVARACVWRHFLLVGRVSNAILPLLSLEMYGDTRRQDLQSTLTYPTHRTHIQVQRAPYVVRCLSIGRFMWFALVYWRLFVVRNLVRRVSNAILPRLSLETYGDTARQELHSILTYPTHRTHIQVQCAPYVVPCLSIGRFMWFALVYWWIHVY